MAGVPQGDFLEPYLFLIGFFIDGGFHKEVYSNHYFFYGLLIIANMAMIIFNALKDNSRRLLFK